MLSQQCYNRHHRRCLSMHTDTHFPRLDHKTWKSWVKGNSFTYSVLKDLETPCQSGCMNWCFMSGIKNTHFLTFHRLLLLAVFLVIVNLIVFFGICLVINGAKHLCLSSYHPEYFLFCKCSVHIFCPVFVWMDCLFRSNFMSWKIYSVSSSFSVINNENIPPIRSCLVHILRCCLIRLTDIFFKFKIYQSFPRKIFSMYVLFKKAYPIPRS